MSIYDIPRGLGINNLRPELRARARAVRDLWFETWPAMAEHYKGREIVGNLEYKLYLRDNGWAAHLMGPKSTLVCGVDQDGPGILWHDCVPGDAEGSRRCSLTSSGYCCPGSEYAEAVKIMPDIAQGGEKFLRAYLERRYLERFGPELEQTPITIDEIDQD